MKLVKTEDFVFKTIYFISGTERILWSSFCNVHCNNHRTGPLLSKYYFQTFFILVSPGYAPVVEERSQQNLEPYLTQDPIQLILNGSFQQVPWLMGGHSQSSVLFIASEYFISLQYVFFLNCVIPVTFLVK
jgi:hypothetical protein